MKKLYNIIDYGAVANSQKLQTEKIQAAVDAAYLAGGGEVVVPKGVFKTGTIKLRSNITLHLLSGATIEGSENPIDYTHFLEDKIEPIIPENEIDDDYGKGAYVLNRWYDAIIKAYRAENVKIIGEKDSIIDGKNVYNPNGEEGYRGPHAIQMTFCKNVELCGYTVKDSANWAHTLFKCQNIFAHNLTVLAGHDGFHTRSCHNVLIEECNIYSGDDCIAGFANENVVIRKCYLDCACSALRYGGSDILVDSCHTHAPSRYGFRGSLSKEERAASASTNETHRHTQHTPFLYFCCEPVKIDKPQGNITIQNCVFENPNSFFRLRWQMDKWVKNRSLVDITFKNCKCTGVSLPIDLYCDENEPCTLRLEDVEISAREGFENVPFMHAQHFKQIYFDNVTVTGYTDPVILTKTEGEVIMKNSTPIRVELTDTLHDKYV
jgi:hypothetical protein